jgi:DNA-binding transcriptional regulator YhcF (GntR family)
MTSPPQGPFKKPTARRHLVAELTGQILNHSGLQDFPIASEHQLCRSFGVSRVTVRLALGDLENNGLIYRRHGKGTFAYGQSTRFRPSLGILIKSSDALKHACCIEIIRGAQAAMTSRCSSLVLISTSPLEWRAETTRNLGAIIVFPQDVSAEELTQLKNRALPFLCIQESQLAVGEADCFTLGLHGAEALADNAQKISEAITRQSDF